jgi:uncharacterized glyoxalase superfamily protein PhnB
MAASLSAMTTTSHGYLSYRDAAAALDWLGRAFGFETTMRFDDDRGTIMHAEARLGDAAIIVFSDDGAGFTRPSPREQALGQGTYLAVDTREQLFIAPAGDAASANVPARSRRLPTSRSRLRSPSGDGQRLPTRPRSRARTGGDEY